LPSISFALDVIVAIAWIGIEDSTTNL
jgi:hypothetical protein